MSLDILLCIRFVHQYKVAAKGNLPSLIWCVAMCISSCVILVTSLYYEGSVVRRFVMPINKAIQTGSGVKRPGKVHETNRRILL